MGSLFNWITEDGAAPKAWRTSVMVPIHLEGRGDVLECSNYHTICIISHAMKIFERILDARLCSIMERTPNQCGFVNECRTMDAIHAARMLLKCHREKNKPVHLAFLDPEKAFNHMPHNLLCAHIVPEAYVQ